MKGYLHLKNGESFEGTLSPNNAKDVTNGEIVFYTGMTGYQEVLTDPSYKNQIIVFTYPLIGNYGINEFDFESKKPHVAGVIVYETKESYSHYNAKHSLKQYLEKWNIPLLAHVDTRAVVKRIRTEGTMQAVISDSDLFDVSSLSSVTNPVEEVTSTEWQTFGTGDTHVVLVDFGYKKSILDSLLARGCKVTVVPYTTSFEKIKDIQPNGIVLSNGPGDPKDLMEQLPNIKQLIEFYPTLAICLGHQLVALSLGGDTTKLKFGHRGANQPVTDILNDKVYITSQNHSYVVDEDSLKYTKLQARFKNCNDKSVEGLTHTTLPILTVQFHPEAHPGPSESSWIFDEFVANNCTVRREKIYA
ncbi:carbamoyl phosphate synthase small subunit [Bacillus timonensis]|uniref:Carbamoyl phosphate synthase small chain n=1 Tax=Bacillus timonensis TaxID=1033734 RepID=A0A4S3PNQ3_9BACI|nr:carbamoyl phosphate synthase small subunit [Bacillus timonensis]THE11200.1 carbamoyl phosphate synthase small subunit [Bacillus timonensis]